MTWYLTVPQSIHAQDDFPPTIDLDVTFFDFHSTGSCPDFNPPDGKDTTTKGMVAVELDKDSLPVRGPRVYFNHFIENWFRPWEKQQDSTKNKKPIYNRSGDPNTSQTHGTLSSMGSGTDVYKNIVINDTIQFRHMGNGVYKYQDEKFFPIDDKGYKKETASAWDNSNEFQDHNYSFTMMLRRVFTYKPNTNMFFSFKGDDDMWVFIDNKLVMDIGGIHQKIVDSFNLDQVATQLGLKPFNKYTMSIFYAERQANESHIWISTNMITVAPNKIDVFGDTLVQIGDIARCTARIVSDTGAILLSNLPNKVQWHFLDPKGLNGPSTFTANAGDSTAFFTPKKAYTRVMVWVTYDDEKKKVHLADTMYITVQPGPPDHLVIEASPEMPTDEWLWKDHPLDAVAIGLSQMENTQFYAILRDKEQNWLRPSNPTAWRSENEKYVIAESGPQPEKGQGKAKRATMDIPDGGVEVKEWGSYDHNGKKLEDDILVKIYSRPFQALRAYYLDTDARPDGYIDEVRIVLDDGFKVVDSMIPILVAHSTLPPQRRFNTISATDGICRDNGFSIKVKQDQSLFGLPITSVNPSQDIFKLETTEFTEIGFIAAAQLSIADSLAPVLTKAVFYPKFITDEARQVRDTLELEYSEDVKVPKSISPYRFFNLPKSIQYSMNVSLLKEYSESHYLFTVDTIVDLKFPCPGDSIWIRAANDIPENEKVPIEQITMGAVEDKYGIYYKERATLPIPLIVKPYNSIVKVIISGPSTIIPPNVKNDLNIKASKGIITVIQPIGGTKIGNAAMLSFQQDIVDPLGNVVRSNMESRWEEKWGIFVIEWDLSNSMERKLRTGSFMFIVRHYYNQKFTGKVDKIIAGFHERYTKD